VPGAIDLLSLTDRRLRTLATTHMSINLAVVVLYMINLWLRTIEPPDFLAGMGLSAIGLVLLSISGWIGGALVHIHGVGVAGHVPEDPRARSAPARTEPSATRLGRS
jgi:uncharacterized membrane protein